MSRINGFGTAYLNFTRPNTFGQSYATVWVTALFLPLFPISRHLVKEIGSNTYNIFARETPVLKEVLRVYLFAWIVYPLIIFGPGIFFLNIWPISALLGVGWTLFSLAILVVVKGYW